MSISLQEATLRAETRQEFIAIGMFAPALRSRATVEKVYEIFVLTCLTRALANLGAQLTAKDKDDQPTSRLVLRLGPGYLASPNSAPGFIHVTYQGKQYEIHNSLRVKGRSQVLHELDVSLIDRTMAQDCRRDGKHPYNKRGSSIKFLAECKFYGDDLPLNLGREYLGLCNEFSLRAKTMVANVESANVKTLINNHQGTHNFVVTPWNPDNVTRFIGWLETELKQVLK